MVYTIATLEPDDFQTLTRMTKRSEPFVATIATATLAIVEARRDAETRAATAELESESAHGRLAAIRELIFAMSENRIDREEAVRQIAILAS